ncbi:molybdopterin-dependent oxidoreductase [Bacteroidota bacterium]
MFRTELTELADVFLPVTGFLENEGHFLSLDGKIQRLRKTVNVEGKSRTIPAIVSALATAMKADGFSASRAGTVWKEIQSNVRIPLQQNGSTEPRFEIMKPAKATQLISGKIRYDHYRYRGNSLDELVPDLKKI